ncbi:MAG: flagellar basal-body rod protein FlgF [Thermodesulfobacteriota bacterium]|nr:flagellar basal-body rod protein FlgF [Thermodesulfobacteriota bacterium]
MYISNRLGLIESTESMMAQEQRLNQVSNNLANVDTPGYKREDLTFWEMIYNPNDDRDRVGKAVKLLTNQEEGAASVTGNTLDFAINGNGFFKVQTPEGVRYTRAGSFDLNSEGQLITPSGHLVLGEGGPITIQGDDVSLSSDGGLLVDGREAGRLDIVTFADRAGLEKEGSNLFLLLEGNQELEAEDFTVKQGYVEKSNVNTVMEMTQMIDLHRAYETQQKLIHTIDEMDDEAIRKVGKLTS